MAKYKRLLRDAAELLAKINHSIMMTNAVEWYTQLDFESIKAFFNAFEDTNAVVDYIDNFPMSRLEWVLKDAGKSYYQASLCEKLMNDVWLNGGFDFHEVTMDDFAVGRCPEIVFFEPLVLKIKEISLATILDIERLKTRGDLHEG